MLASQLITALQGKVETADVRVVMDDYDGFEVADVWLDMDDNGEPVIVVGY